MMGVYDYRKPKCWYIKVFSVFRNFRIDGVNGLFRQEFRPTSFELIFILC